MCCSSPTRKTNRTSLWASHSCGYCPTFVPRKTSSTGLFRHLRAPWACPDWLLPAGHLRAAVTPTPSAPGSGARTCPVYIRPTGLGGAFCP